MKAVVYTTPTCKYCGAAKDLLMMKGYQVEEIDVQHSLEKRAEMVEKTKSLSVPGILVDGRVFVGLDALEAYIYGKK